MGRIEAMFGGQQPRPDLVWCRFGSEVWCRLAIAQPRALMGWIDAHADTESLPSELLATLPLLLRADTRWVVGALASRIAWVAKVGLPRGLPRRVAAASDAELLPLCRGLAQSAPLLLGDLFSRLPSPRRARLFEAAIAGLETARIEWPTGLLARLPTPQRDREALRMLGLARAAIDARWRRELLGLREITQARSELEREGRSAQAVDRAQAHASLVRSTARSRTGMPETLAWLGRRRNEQDRMAERRLVAAVEGLMGERHPEALLLLERIAVALLASPPSFALGARLRVAATPNPELAANCLALLASAPTRRQQIAIEEAARAAAALDARDWSVTEAQTQVESLRSQGAELVALALLGPFGRRWGWGEAWTAPLARLREHEDLDVRLVARRLWIATD